MTAFERFDGLQAHLHALVQALAPLTTALRAWMPQSVRKVGGRKDPGVIALCIVALRWPDRSLPGEYITGHRLVGHIGTSHLFRDIEQDPISDPALQRGFFGPQATPEY